MDIRIDFRSEQPIYLQIVEQVRDLVANGDLVPGDQLPTVRQMATDLRVNFNTVARAYRILDESGLISTQHGRGTYVWEIPSEETRRRLHNQNLYEQLTHFIQALSRRGYALHEIEAAFSLAMRDEKRGTHEIQQNP